MLRQEFGEETFYSFYAFFYCISHFWNNYECDEGEVHTLWPHSVRMPETIQNVLEFVTSDRQMIV